MAGPKESVIEKQLVERVHALGGICDKVQVIGCRGFCDRLVALPGGHILLIELKRPKGGRLSAHQQHYQKLYGALGVTITLVKNSADIDRLLLPFEAKAAE